MRIISRKLLREFWEWHPEAQQVLQSWYADVKQADWQPADIKKMYPHASFLAHNRVVFNIKGNTYRLVVMIHYKFRLVFIRFIGTHKEYDRIDAATI